MKRNKNFTIILVAALILVGIIVVTIVIGLSLPEHPDIIQGQAETTDYRLSSKVPARVCEIRVQEGDHVRRGDTLVILEAPDIRAKLSQAEAAYAAAQAQELKAQNGTRQEQVQQAYEMWQKARAAMEVAGKTYHRINRLFENGVMAEQKRDEAQAQYEAMVATERAARSQYDMAVNGARLEDKAAAGAQVQRAQGAVSEVTSYMDETVLLATADGVVTEIFPELGELVGTGAPIMNVSCTDDVWFTFNIREDLLPGLTVGTETEVYLPAFDKRIPVRIIKMKDVGTFAVWKATKALDGFDLKTFEVKARPLNAEGLENVRSGMSVIMEK
ncbi:HlyD family secretion protein [Bacteroides eggerthii]|jgi:HlyD family secretion protein|uniref:HlyD family secretion protein n=1 Tax=Bacteroides eggerthii TaxID=28111 RepID=UPI0022E58239|nr:efflux RND transporter periplasmic adaptor subunit [Bacteroides eggerthii]